MPAEPNRLRPHTAESHSLTHSRGVSIRFGNHRIFDRTEFLNVSRLGQATPPRNRSIPESLIFASLPCASATLKPWGILAVAPIVFAMKTTLYLCLAILAAGSAQAQIFRPATAHRAVPRHHPQVHVQRGGDDFYHRSVAHHRSVARSGFHHSREYRGHEYSRWNRGHSPYLDRHYHGHAGFGVYGSRFGYGYSPGFGYHGGYGYGYPYDRDFGYYGPRSAASSGLLLGALAGGIIGHHSGDLHHSAWRGSAWGAGLGWLLGSVVDANRLAAVYQPAPVVVQQAPVVQPAAPAQPQQVTIINNYYNSSTPMGAANGMFGR